MNLSKLMVGWYLAQFHFLIRYRRTALGPVWLLVGPCIFIAFLGQLYAHIGAANPAIFIPHLAIGLVLWTLIAGFINQSATIYQRGRAQIMQAGLSLNHIVMVDVMSTVFQFLHQIIIIAVVLLIYKVPLGWSALLFVPGLALIIANGIWITQIFGILGARYRDLHQIFQAVMRIAFLATPIIWMPGAIGRGGVIGHFLFYNPFYHFLEIARAPLLGNPVEPLSWMVVLSFTVVSFILARFMATRYGHLVPLWV